VCGIDGDRERECVGVGVWGKERVQGFKREKLKARDNGVVGDSGVVGDREREYVGVWVCGGE
jgi:hypothetical protein